MSTLFASEIEEPTKKATEPSGSLFSGLEVVGQENDENPPEERAEGFGPHLGFLDELNGESFDLEKALLKMQDLKARAASLPDNERRELAASVALKFAMLLGDDDSDELDFH